MAAISFAVVSGSKVVIEESNAIGFYQFFVLHLAGNECYAVRLNLAVRLSSN